jgi:hypothetical protein
LVGFDAFFPLESEVLGWTWQLADGMIEDLEYGRCVRDGKGFSRVALLIFTVGLGMAAAGVASAGYLPIVGPGLMRFESVSTPSAVLILPPLPLGDVTPPELSAGNQITSEQTLTNLGPMRATEPGSDVLAAPFESQLLSTSVFPPESSSANGTKVMTPSMLLEYFQVNASETNKPANTVLIPFEFVPPRPNRPASSKATFSNP